MMQNNVGTETGNQANNLIVRRADMMTAYRRLLSKAAAAATEGNPLINPSEAVLTPAQFVELPTGRLFLFEAGTQGVIRVAFTDPTDAITCNLFIWKLPVGEPNHGSDASDVQPGRLPEQVGTIGTPTTFTTTNEEARLGFVAATGQVIVHTDGSGGVVHYLSAPVEFALAGCNAFFVTLGAIPAAGGVEVLGRIY